MPERRILRLTESGELLIATEATFESEERLHHAIARHPEVLPSEDLGLGPLVTIANEIDLGHGPIDTLAVDGAGRLVIIEFKRGSENPDVRKVVAQVLDYGSALWRVPYEQLEEVAAACDPGLRGSLVEHVSQRLAELGTATVDAEAFRRGVETGLDTGDFVFLYVARDLDDRTRRIMTFLAEGPRMSFFGVEVDYFRGVAGDSVLVPRIAFVPSWVGESGRPVGGVGPTLQLEAAPEPVQALATLLDEVASELGLTVSQARASRIYRPARNAPGITLYLDGRKAEFDLESFRSRGDEAFAEDFCVRLDALVDRPVRRGPYPGVPPTALLANWDSALAEVIRHYFAARLEHIAEDGEPRPLDVEILHRLLSRLPAGRWTTYGDVASAVGSHPRAVGGHIGNCGTCRNAWRVLQTSGVVSHAFRWSDPDRHDDPRAVLESEGVPFEGNRAHPDARLGREELLAFL